MSAVKEQAYLALTAVRVLNQTPVSVNDVMTVHFKFSPSFKLTLLEKPGIGKNSRQLYGLGFCETLLY